jgi:uncharacterized membrane protein
MPFCVNCGSEVQGRFCSQCGARVNGGAQSTGAPYAPAASGALQENVASALCYLLGILTGVLFLAIEPYNRSRAIRFHAFQSIFAWAGATVASIGVSIITRLWAVIPYAGWVFGSLIWSAFGLAIFILWLVLMYKAYNGEKWVLPVIGPLAEKQA